MSDGIYYIYKITNKINNKIYIGFTSKTIQERLQEHINKSQKSSAKKQIIHKAIKKYGKENFIIEEVDSSTDYNYCLNVLEPYYIKLYNALDKSIGYNVGTGGEGGDNYTNNPMLEEIRNKISQSLKNFYKEHNGTWYGKTLSDEHKNNIKKSNIGEKLKIKFNTPKYKQMFREMNLGENNPIYGKHLSEETKLLLSQKLKGRKKSPKTIQKMKQAITPEKREMARKKIIEYNKSLICRQKTIKRNKEMGMKKRHNDIVQHLDFFTYLFDILDQNVFTKKLYLELQNCPFNYCKVWGINKNKEEWKKQYMEIINAK